jgi:acyl-CoA synthetase (AMP-forming)/AMP-acid ligase II
MVRDTAAGKPLPPENEGELCVAAPSLMDGYLNDGKADVFFEYKGKKFLRTGDYGHVDKDGFFFFKQRIKRIIIVSGVNIYPSEIEATAAGVPEVEICAAIGVADKLRGQTVKLFVKLKDGDADKETVKEKIWQKCRDNLIAYAVPKSIEFIADMPKTAYGKTDYKQLEGQ